jgi:4-hydroxy-2-oxoheptanedioate aldolase
MARQAAEFARFHPLGNRGMHPYVRSASYRAFPTAEYLEAANRDTTVVVHVEGAGGLRDLDAILMTPGIDVVFLGPYDLSQALGVPGQVNDPRIEAAIRDAVAKCPPDRVIGTYADSPDGVRKWREAGVRYLTMNIDAGMLHSAARSAAQEARS